MFKKCLLILLICPNIFCAETTDKKRQKKSFLKCIQQLFKKRNNDQQRFSIKEYEAKFGTKEQVASEAPITDKNKIEANFDFWLAWDDGCDPRGFGPVPTDEEREVLEKAREEALREFKSKEKSKRSNL